MIESVVLAALMVTFLILFIRELIKRKNTEKAQQAAVQAARVDAVKRSRASVEGQIYEQFVPHFPEWNHEPSDARFLGTPVDYIVFDGMSKGRPEQITIIEVKKGSSTTTRLQNQIRDLIKEGKVVWELLKIK